MSTILQQRLASLEVAQKVDRLAVLEGRRVGLEKENLRVQASGLIATSDHPEGLGSALCNRYITTDYSEALLELVTPALKSVDEALHFLSQVQRFVHRNLQSSEFIWNTSMPCVLQGSKRIRIGNYGSSNTGQMKSVYRRGLGLRYGKAMQTIAGVHFNHSWPAQLWPLLAEQVRSAASGYDESLVEYARSATEEATKDSANHSSRFVSEMYLGATRNLLRNTWLIPLLFGASPAICKTFLEGREPMPGMQVHNGSTYYQPYATSLRMGDIGYNYSKKAAANITVDYSNLDSFTADLHRLITTRHEGYDEMGLMDEDGRYQQLNTNLLQVENEYYSPVRPKQLVDKQEPPVLAMRRRGILYTELRCLDVNVFEPLGMCDQQLHFLEAFMLHALLSDSPPISSDEMLQIGRNMSKVAHNGRDPEAQITLAGKSQNLRSAAMRLLDEIEGVAELMDRDSVLASASTSASTSPSASTQALNTYGNALQAQREKVENYELTPSARVLDEIFTSYGSFYDFAEHHSAKASAYCESVSLDTDLEQLLQTEVTESVERQHQLEQESAQHFDAFLADYFAQLD